MKILVTGGSGFIGTNYAEFLLSNKIPFINLDCRPPRNKAHKQFWRACDILDYATLEAIVKEFQPTHVVHLAAKTGLHQKELHEFAANIDGVQNIIDALKQVRSVECVVFTSTLLVCEMGYVPQFDTDYRPTTLYGESKVEGEKVVRVAEELPFTWSIVRPISVWGPWQEEPYINFFKSVAKNWYFHIGPGHYQRSMGYVENMACQFHRLLLAPHEKVDKKTFYLGDNVPVDIYDLADEIKSTLGTSPISHVPLWAARLAAMTGDVLKLFGWRRFPLTSFRLKNIRTEYVFDLSPIMEITGPLPYDFKTSVRRAIEWMREAGQI